MFTLTTDSSCDLLKSQLKEMDVPYIPLIYIIDGVSYEDRLDSDEEYAAFYDKLRQGAMPTTSQISEYSFEQFFTQTLEERPGLDIVHLCLSSGVSGTYANAVTAAKAVTDGRDEKIYIVDTLAASQGLRLVLDRGVEFRDGGMSAADAFEKLCEISRNLHHWVILENLAHLKRGGRISAVKAAIGTMIKLKPILVANKEGNLLVYKKVIGSAKAVTALVQGLKDHSLNKVNPRVYVANTDNDALAEKVRQEVLIAFPQAEVIMGHVGPVIGAHLGNNCVAIMFEAAERIDIN